MGSGLGAAGAGVADGSDLGGVTKCSQQGLTPGVAS